jgi:hypothetical protein
VVPAGTGFRSSSTSSTTARSPASTSTGSSGAVTPSTPSLEPNWSTTGTPNAAATRRRTSTGNCSLLPVTIRGAIRSRPASCSAASTASADG